ncbi:MAG: hypothetical protein HQ568_04440 [Calditrichaeota bacterium]|nr:hypothetical protein [Calditrichota bacterium]
MGTYRDIFIPSDESLTIITYLNELYADSAYAIIREQVFSQDDILEYDDPNKMTSAVVDSGWAYFELWNSCPMDIALTTYFLDVTGADGDTLSSTIMIGPGTPQNPVYAFDSTDLSGSTVELSLDDQSLRVLAKAVTVDTEPEYFDINGSQGIEGKYWIGDLSYSEFTGLLDNLEIELTTQELEVDIPDNVEDLRDNVQFQQHRITLDTFNETSSPVLLDVGFYAACETEDTTAKDTTFIIFDIISPGIDSIKFNLGFIPDLIRYVGWARAGARFLPGYEDIVSLNKSEGVRVDVRMQSELKISVTESSLKSDPTFLEDGLDLEIESVDLNIRLTNTIPVDGSLRLLAGTDTTNMDTVMHAVIPVGLITDHRAEAVTESYVISLNQQQIDIIIQPNVYIQQLIELQSTEGNTVWLYGADSLDVKAYAEIRYIVDPGENNE